MSRSLSAACLAGVLILAGSAQAQPAPSAPAPDYARPDHWLCRPGRQDACARPLDATVLTPRGVSGLESPRADPAAAVDCFYVYPTVSADRSPNSDLIPDEKGEIAIATDQAARFGPVCRVYAPMYRSITAPSGPGGGPTGSADLAYADVRAAWRRYMSSDNGGRGVIIIGHSQGANMLRRLIAEEIDGKPGQQRLVSAILAGTPVLHPPGADLGGSFKFIPLCRRQGQFGCVITYATYRDGIPAKALYGRSPDPAMAAACTNPAELRPGGSELHPYVPVQFNGLDLPGTPAPQPWLKSGQAIRTPYVALPGLLNARCVTEAGVTALVVTAADAADSARSGMRGEIYLGGMIQPDRGLHLADIFVAQGDLIDIVRLQSAAWRASLANSGR